MKLFLKVATCLALLWALASAYRSLLQGPMQAEKDNDDQWKSSKAIQVEPNKCGYFVLKPGKKYKYKAFIDSVQGCDKFKVSKLYMDGSCIERDMNSLNQKDEFKIFGKTIKKGDVGSGDTATTYPCTNGIADGIEDSDIIDWEDSGKLQTQCYQLGDTDSSNYITYNASVKSDIAKAGDQGYEYDSSNVCYTYGNSEYAVIFLDNQDCKGDGDAATVNLSVKQLDYDGVTCPSRTVIIIIIVVVVVVAILLATAVVCCVLRCCCR